MLVAAFIVFAAHNAWKLQNGIQIGGDTSRYTETAQNLIHGRSIKGKAKGYIGYSATLAIIKILTPDGYDYLTIAISLQIIIATIALFCLYKIGQILFSTSIGVAAVSISSVNYIVVRWNHWVLAESLFTSLLVISVFLCIKAARNSNYVFIALPTITLTALLRPNGMVLLLVFLVYLYFQYRDYINRVALVSISLMLAIIVVFAVGELEQSARNEVGVGMRGAIVMDGEWGAQKHYRKLPVPEVEVTTENAIVGNLAYIVEQPIYSLHLMACRLYAFYSLTRADYSVFHNKFLYILMPIFYVLALLGMFASLGKNMSKDHLLILGIIAGQSAIVAFSLADHDHRYFSYIVNFIVLYFCCGFSILYIWLKSADKSVLTK